MAKYYDKVKIIFRKSLAYKLRELGFDIVRVKPNKNKPQFDVYYFEDTPKFEEAFYSLVK